MRESNLAYEHSSGQTSLADIVHVPEIEDHCSPTMTAPLSVIMTHSHTEVVTVQTHEILQF